MTQNLQKIHQPVTAAAMKKPTTAPKLTGNMRRKHSAANRKDNLDTNSVMLVEEKVGTKDKGAKNKRANDQKGPGTDNIRSNQDKPNW